MKVIVTPDARGSIDAIYNYITLDSPAQAQRVQDRILAAAQSLSILPHRGRPGQVEDTREVLVKRLPYTLVYTVVGDTVYVLGVYHQHTDR